ncbi:MAG: hypothetical protein L0Z55_12700 [Planctomycetes bacterium]|nr:hypothetical protein [Planctomycetota bacterium]
MDPLRNLLLVGLGAVSYSQEKLKTAIGSLIDRGDLSREQGERVLSEWLARGKDEQAQITQRISTEMAKLMQKLALVSREEFDELKRRVEKLEH